MKYFKNTQLAKLYHVSEKSVRNWTSAALEGKLDLQIIEENGHQYIANTAKNTAIVEQLVLRGKKYKNSRGFKRVVPSKKFYEIYSPQQVIDIVANLDIYHESPLQYTYFNGGARRWDSYVKRLLRDDESNALSNTVNLLNMSTDYLDMLLEGCTGVNIIDLGVGNAMPVRELVQHFQTKKLLKRYIGIDISKDMLDIARDNLSKWFDNSVQAEWHLRDLTYERFSDLLAVDAFGSEAGSIINIVLFLGGTLTNFRTPNQALTTIHDSMAKHDILLYSKKVDHPKSRRFFEMANPGGQAIELLLDLLNIDRSYYTIDPVYDERNRQRQVYAKIEVALALEFELNGQTSILHLEKGERILLWRARHQTMLDILQQFNDNGFEPLHAIRSADRTYALTISSVKRVE